MRRGPALFLLLLAPLALAQRTQAPDAIVLVAKPGLVDPNFRETVVLVTRTVDAQTVGVILNRPTDIRLPDLWRDSSSSGNYRDAVYFGGPVMRRTVVAVFRSPSAPAAAAFPVLKDIYLSMHPANIEPLLRGASGRYRLYAGFSGWAPRQLENEIAAGGWYILAAREELLFREQTAGMWQELVDQASGARARRDAATDLAILAP